MPRGYVPLLLLLAALWGASYLFIKVGVRELEPVTLMALRLAIAFAILFGVLAARSGVARAFADLRATGRHGIVLGLLNAAIPFWLIAWGETHVDSGIAAIANSTVPIFVALLAIRLRPSERASGLRLAGILVGLLGVGVLTGVHPEGGWWAVAGTLAVVLSSVFYARANLYTQDHFASTPPLVTATACIGVATVVILPFGLLQLPDTVPSWKAFGSAAALAVLGTALAYLVLYRMLAAYGSARTSLVTYLLPVFALAYGALILDEPLRLSALLGLVLILGGVALGSGMVRLPRRATVRAARNEATEGGLSRASGGSRSGPAA
jgi:drug/metabolite transporter (DMT)-like permease